MPKIRTSILLLLIPFLIADIATATDSTWAGPGSDFNSPGNWDMGVPAASDLATFNTANPVSINLSADTAIGGLIFNPGASAYTINANSHNLSINDGIDNFANLAFPFTQQTLTTTGGQIYFGGTNPSNVVTSNIMIINSNLGSTVFNNSTIDDVSIINNGGTTQFNSANAVNTIITNNTNGHAVFTGVANYSDVSIINNSGGTVDISGTTSGALFNSISGAGNISLGSLTPESLSLYNGNSSISGVISGLGSLIKAGTGTLILSGQNTFSSGTNGVSPDVWVQGGTLQAAGYGAIPIGSAVTVDSGATLQFTDSQQSTQQIISSLSGGGAFGGVVLGSNTTLVVGTNSSLGPSNLSSTFAGAISGSGSLLKTGSGALTLTGDNTYTGATIISGTGGILAGAPNTLSRASAVVMTNLTAQLYVGANNQTIGSLAGVGQVALGGATLTIGADNTSTTFTGQIGDVMGTSSSIVKIGNGTLTLNLGDVLEDPIQVSAGRLNFQGNQGINNDIAVNSGATLLSASTMQNLTNNGVVNPGVNGVGTLTAATYSGRGALNINFNGTPTNLLRVTGNANLTGGSLNLLGTSFTSGRYTVLSAGSVTGTFTSVAAPDTVFLKFSTVYDPTDVQIDIAQTGFASAAQNGNQGAVSAALDTSSSHGNAAFTTMTSALLQLNASQAQAAFSQISGDALTSFHDVGLRTAAVFNNQMLDHGSPDNSLINAGLTMPTQLAYNGDVQNLTGLKNSSHGTPHGLWTRGIGLFDHTNADSSLGSPSSQANTGGFQVGYDYTLSDEWLLGISGGYATTALSVDDRSSSGNSTTYDGGLYARYAPSAWFFNGSIAYSGSSNDNTRTISFPGISEQAKAGFNSHVVTEFGEAGYSFKPGNAFLLEPSVGLRASQLHQDAYHETGAPGLDLSVGDQNPNSTVSLLGTRLSRIFFQNTSHPLSLGTHAAWEHELGSADNLITAQFVDAPGASFTVQGTSRPRNSADLGVDARINLTKNLQSFANYFANLGTGENVQGIMGGLSLKW